MEKNVGTIDKALRTVIAIVIGVLYYMEIINGTVAIVAGVIGIAFLLTSLFGVCPLYIPLGINTGGKK